MEIIAEITRPGFAKLSIGDYSLCPLSEGSQGGVREAAVAAGGIHCRAGILNYRYQAITLRTQFFDRC